MPLLEVKNLETHFFLRRGVVKAVNDISFSVDRGETLGIVGESGSGKTMTGLSIMRLIPKPGRIVGGSIMFDGTDLLKMTEKEMTQYRGSRITQILQDPLSSLNPVFTVGNQVGEGLALHQHMRGQELKGRAIDLLQRLGIPAAAERFNDYPHQFSGGMRQRVVGATCLACDPDLLIADEPTTSLDVTIQIQYLNMLKDIQAKKNLAMIFVTHDFGVVAKMCDRVAVMYAGRIVETGSARDIFDRPSHPYTHALIESVPTIDEKVERLHTIGGQPPNLLTMPSGCAFQPRCPDSHDRCLTDVFPYQAEVGVDHTVKCWKYVD